MNTWGIFQLLLNLALIAVGVAIYVRSKRPKKDDPRLSKGLQLLQSKIAILEDLSDRVDNQVKQLTNILDQKAKMTHEHAEMIQEHLNQVEHSIQRSLEVSKIFQDKIPHKEIIERQNTIKYIQAARMANQGHSVEDIAKLVDIPKSELEFIVKVNKDRLMFSEKDLPSWALNSVEIKEPLEIQNFVPSKRDYSQAYETLTLDQHIENEDKKIENDFKQSVKSFSDLNKEEILKDVQNNSQSETESQDVMTPQAPLFESYIPREFNESSISQEAEVTASHDTMFADPKSQETPLIQKIGELVEDKLGFKAAIHKETEPVVSKSSFQIQKKNKEAIKNTLKLKQEISKQADKKTVRPFVFTRLD
jgi:hypothetical protein